MRTHLRPPMRDRAPVCRWLPPGVRPGVAVWCHTRSCSPRGVHTIELRNEQGAHGADVLVCRSMFPARPLHSAAPATTPQNALHRLIADCSASPWPALCQQSVSQRPCDAACRCSSLHRALTDAYTRTRLIRPGAPSGRRTEPRRASVCKRRTSQMKD